MKNHKYYQKRNRYKQNNDRQNNFGASNRQVFDISNGINFKRNNTIKNNQNAGKLVEKYNDLAREALSNGDKILSENYLQHSEHFSRILISQENSRNQSEKESGSNISNQLKAETENKESEDIITK